MSVHYPSKHVSHLPVYVDETEIDTEGEIPVSHSTKAKLNKLIPGLPSFSSKSPPTSLLYSKFIMKGMKQDKIPMVRKTLHRKETMTQTNTQTFKKTNKKYAPTDYDERQFESDPHHFTRVNSMNVLKKDSIWNSNTTPALQRTSTEVNLKRPQTAFKQSDHSQPRKKRPTSGCNQRIQQPSFYDEKNFPGFVQNQQLMIIDELIDQKLKPDHIKRNVRQVSGHSQKSRSIYLTRPAQGRSQGVRGKEGKKKQVFGQFLEIQQIHKASKLKTEEKQIFHKKSQYYADYYKKTMPGQFISKFQQLPNENGSSSQNALESIGFDQPLEVQISQELQKNMSMEDQEMEYLKTYEIFELKVKPKEQKRDKRNMLDIWQCRKIMDIYQRLKQTNPEQALYQKTVDELYHEIQSLGYFKHHGEEHNHKLMLLPFTISIRQEEEVIYQVGDAINNIFVILNGSVLITPENTINSQRHTFSMFDGEAFGQPSKPSQESYSSIAVALEQTMLMEIPYSAFRKSFYGGSGGEEKMRVLKMVFSSELESGLMKLDELEVLCLYMEGVEVEPRSLLFRKQETFEDVILVSKGSLLPITELIIKRPRPKNPDLKHKTPPKHSRPPLDVLRMRKFNLINYELLHETETHIYYYYQQQEDKEFKVGDVINWHTITTTIGPQLTNTHTTQTSAKPMQYSLMGNMKSTTVYTISRKSLHMMPIEVKKILLSKAEAHLPNQTSFNQDNRSQCLHWQKFKRKLCEDIIGRKKKLHIF